jgi:hypothetical protein
MEATIPIYAVMVGRTYISVVKNRSDFVGTKSLSVMGSLIHRYTFIPHT